MTKNNIETPTEDEQILNYRDDQERKQKHDFKTGNRRTPLSNNVLLLLGDLLQPQTEGFDHINLDMTFTNLNEFDLYNVQNSSFIITWCTMHGIPKATYQERGKLATLLNSKRSYKAKSMEMFTTTVTHQKVESEDKTKKEKGFGAIFKKKE